MEERQDSGKIDLMEGILSAADEYFPKIDENSENHDLLSRVLQIPSLADTVVRTLEREEGAGSWPLKDEDIKQYISTNCREYQISLPEDPEQLKRWFCLIYMASSILNNFSYGNVVRVTDITGEEDELSG